MADAIAPELLARVFVSTLEDAAFAFVEPVEDAPPMAGKVIEARLAWTGAAAGEVRLAVEPALAAALAANLLGDDDPAPARAADAVGELVNMAVGVLVHEAFGGRAEIRLGLPRVAEVDGASWAASLAGAGSVLSLQEEEGRRLDVAQFDGGARP